jgi:hypothetical protein
MSDYETPPLPIVSRPDPYGLGGHYRTTHRGAIIALQAAASRLFAFRSASASLYTIIHEISVRWLQTADHTAAIEDSLDLAKCSGFTVVDATGSPVTPAVSKGRTSMPAAAAEIRGNALAGLAAGMTGGTPGTVETVPLRQLGMWLLATNPTAGPAPVAEMIYRPQVADGIHPMLLAPDEGFVLRNRVLLGAAAGSSYYISVDWSEVPFYGGGP